MTPVVESSSQRRLIPVFMSHAQSHHSPHSLQHTQTFTSRTQRLTHINQPPPTKLVYGFHVQTVAFESQICLSQPKPRKGHCERFFTNITSGNSWCSLWCIITSHLQASPREDSWAGSAAAVSEGCISCQCLSVLLLGLVMKSLSTQ